MARTVSAMDGGEYKNVRNVFEHWSEATMARQGEAGKSIANSLAMPRRAPVALSTGRNIFQDSKM